MRFMNSKETAIDPGISSSRLFLIWATIGTQSFGGGSATLYLIQRMAVERYRWITADDFTRYWGICQVVPGINILALVILIGSRVAGTRGVLLSLSGLLLPSAGITIGLTAFYASVRDVSLVRAAIAGIVPATVGLGLLLGFSMVRSLLKGGPQDGWVSIAVGVLVLVISAILAALGRTPVLAILWGAGVASALAQWRIGSRQRPTA